MVIEITNWNSLLLGGKNYNFTRTFGSSHILYLHFNELELVLKFVMSVFYVKKRRGVTNNKNIYKTHGSSFLKNVVKQTLLFLIEFGFRFALISFYNQVSYFSGF